MPSKSNSNKLIRLIATASAMALAALVPSCDKVPDHCADHVKYEPAHQFCFAGKAHNRCGGYEYNPLTEGCAEGAAGPVVGTRCADSTFVKFGNPCAGYTLTFATAPKDGGTVDSPHPNKSSVPAGDAITLVATESDGYAFAGWAGAGAQSSADKSVSVTMDANVSLIAMFNPVSAPGASKHTLVTTAFPEEGGNISVDGGEMSPSAATALDTGKQVTVFAVANEGYTFDGWSGSGAPTSKSANATVAMDESKTIVAVFKPKIYTLIASAIPADGGAVFVGGSALSGSSKQEANARIEAIAIASEGYYFSSWGGNAGVTGTERNRVEFNVTDSGMTIIANFKKGVAPAGADTESVYYSLSTFAEPEDGGTVERKPSQERYGAGKVVVVTATPGPNRKFVGWQGEDGATGSSIDVVMDGNKALTAVFDIDDPTKSSTNYKLTASASPASGGTVFVNGDTATSAGKMFESGAEVSVVAVAAQGYEFTGWTGASTLAKDTITLTMDGNRTLTAGFKQKPKGRSFNVSFEGVDGFIQVDSGTAIPVGNFPPNPTKMGYTFSGWFEGSKQYTSNTLITKDVTLKATWTPGATVVDGWQINPDYDYGTVSDKNGKSYKTTTLGNQKWMAENLNYPILITATDSTWCYENHGANCEAYGRLYNWYAAIKACPEGWRLPTRKEWIAVFEDVVGVQGTVDAYDNPTWPGVDSKLGSQVGWEGGGFGEDVQDTYGFSAIRSGYRYAKNVWDPDRTHGAFFDYSASWWTAERFIGWTDPDPMDHMYAMHIHSNAMFEYANPKDYGQAVRCVEGRAAIVSFDVNGGETSRRTIHPTVVEVGGTLSEDYINGGTWRTDGYELAGWFDESDMKYTETTKITKDVTLKAKWERISYTVTFNANNGSEHQYIAVSHGDHIGIASVPTPTYTGYVFAGWYRIVEDVHVMWNFSEDVVVGDNMWLHAKWQRAKGQFADPRDGKEYQTIAIGDQVWMAENLNYHVWGADDKGKSWCHGNDPCTEGYGRYYDMDAIQQNDICPDGWKLPDDEDWAALATLAASVPSQYRSLKSANGWDGTDELGFSALPGGYHESVWTDSYEHHVYGNFGNAGYWWSNDISIGAGNVSIWVLDGMLRQGIGPENGGYSVRCIQSPQSSPAPLSAGRRR